VWGALNGAYLISAIVTKSSRDRIYARLGLDAGHWFRQAIGIGTTFVLTCAAWIVFRANSLADAAYVFTHFWRGWDAGAIATEQFLMRQMPAAILAIVVLESVQLLHRRISLTRQVARFPVVVRWPVYAGFVLLVVLLGVYRNNQFIYFQF
jgi:alginate O-acetyltransferase complex protein AlgI